MASSGTAMTSSNRLEDAKLMSGNGPVFFLVQQQAKSIVAVQELQSRMTVLEGLQGRLMQAIKDIRHHLASQDRQSTLKVQQTVHAKPPLKSNLSKSNSVKKNSQLEDDISENTRKLSFSEEQVWSDSVKSFANDTKHVASKSDSYNKDSGIGGDSSLSEIANNDEDELLQLLDLIDQKSIVLLKQVDQATEERKSAMSSRDYSQSLDHLLFEKVESQRQLSEVRAERDELKHRLAELESATELVLKEKKKVQESLEVTLSEKQTLEEKMQKSFGTDPQMSCYPEKLGYLADIEKSNVKKKYLQYSEKSKKRVSTVLKETSVLELQKHLLTYIMENDVLRAKLEQDHPTRLSNWLKVESRLKEELREAKEGLESLQRVIEMKDSEIIALKNRVAAMEEAMENETGIRNFGLGSADDWRDPTVQVNNPYNKMSNLNAVSNSSPLGYGDFSKTQSLPAILLMDSKQNKQELQQHYSPIFDTDSFTDVPLDQSFSSCAPNRSLNRNSTYQSRDLVDLGGPSSTCSSMDTLVQQQPYLSKPTSGISSTPNLSSAGDYPYRGNWELRHKVVDELGAKLVNGHLCWKGLSKDISSICTEFDPLSETPSCENFVDSLNLSIPLKPTQVPVSSQLSSIGDSLHSTSLDLVCVSTPTVQESRYKNIIQNARSVDGIRDMLADKDVYNRNRLLHKQHVKPGRHPKVAIKNGRQNLTKCFNGYSDYSLL